MRGMNKGLATVGLLCLFAFNGFSQDNLTSKTISVYPHDSESNAKDIIRQIVEVVGLKPNFEIRAGNVPNAAAIISNGKRFIIYDPVFIEKINSVVNTDWGGIYIIAHEIGHHLNGHTLLQGGSKPETELEADEFAGYVLRKMGATIVQGRMAVGIISREKETASHPSRAQRIESMETGWNHADYQLSPENKPVPLMPKESEQDKQEA